MRDVNPEGMSTAAKAVERKIKEVADIYGLKAGVKLMGELDSIKLPAKVIEIIENVAQQSNMTYKKMNSGAVHDSCLLAGITDVGMIFVPSINGRSHVPEESTNYEDIKLGCDVLLGSVFALAS